VNTPRPEPSEDFEGVEELLRVLAPTPVPSEIQRKLIGRMQRAGRRANHAPLWLAAAAVLVVAAAPFVYRGSRQAVESGETPAANPGQQGDSHAQTPAMVEETTDVFEVQDAGTTPMQDGAYRIVRITFIHRTWDIAGGNPLGRVLSKRTSQGYMAVPLEVF
jgi:hypothetical protein